MVGINSKNKNILDKQFICAVCSLILRDPIQFITCGHRICQSCYQFQNQSIIVCPKCQTKIVVNKTMLDRGFQKDMQSIPIICFFCEWTDSLKNYQEHLDQSHSNPKCPFCDQQFNSVNQFNQHNLFECRMITVDCLLKDFGCYQKIVRCELSDHYLTQQHIGSVHNVIEKLKLSLTDTPTNTDRPHLTTTVDNNFFINQLKELYDATSILSSGTEELNVHIQSTNSESIEHENRLKSLIENTSQLKLALEEQHGLIEGVRQNLDILYQDVESLKEKYDDMQCVSYDGTYTWKITKLQEKMRDAQSERQTSVYSPPFYSSLVGYKMRARLYLNGDGNARRTHMSLFFVLMRGQNDSILKFPFNYKVTFCLYDQTSAQRHIIDSFRPDIRSNSFQRPRSEMNIASGIPKFFPLAMIQQENNPYVQDDTIFIKILVDFNDMPKSLLPFILSLNPGLPTNAQQEIIKQEIQRRSQQENPS